ncbi:MAG: hypothetical protein R3Y49_01840 [Rikenellaceae bacterium]
MLLTIGIILTLAVGFLTIKSFSNTNELSSAEIIGLAFPMGLLIEVMVLVVLDFVRLPLNITSTLLFNTTIIAALYYFISKQKGRFTIHVSWKQIKQYLSSKNIVWLMLLAIIAYLEYQNFVKCIYFPTVDRDSIAAFDTLGYVFAQEGCISASSIFDPSYNLAIKDGGSYLAYPPFTQVSYAFVYIFGAETSKLIPALLFLSFIFACYGVLQREIKATGAMLVTLFITITPEMISFSSLSGTNVIHAIYASLGVIYALKWILKAQSTRDTNFWCSALLLSANFLVRSEGIIFIGATGLFILLNSIKAKSYKNMLLWVAITITPALIWKLHQMLTGMTTESFVITELFYDSEKARTIYGAFKFLFTNQTLFGWTFIVLLCSCIATLLFIKRDPRVWIGWSVLLISVVGYAIVLYQVDYVWDSLLNVLNYSAKRYFFCFVPIAWYLSVTNYPVKQLLIKMDGYLSLK